MHNPDDRIFFLFITSLSINDNSDFCVQEHDKYIMHLVFLQKSSAWNPVSVVVAVVVYLTFCFRFSLSRIFCKVKKKKNNNWLKRLIAEVGELRATLYRDRVRLKKCGTRLEKWNPWYFVPR